MKAVLKSILFILLIPVSYFLVIIILGTLLDYRPEEKELISEIEDEFLIADSNIYSIVSWNIGYGGLGSEMDFFYDGGKQVRDLEDNVRRNMYYINEWVLRNDTNDFILLQEVDLSSKRSYKINQYDMLNSNIGSHFPFMAYNYKSFFVPTPVFEPLGKVHSGLLSLTKHIPYQSTRYSFPGNYSWPTSLFMLDRCFLVNSFRVSNGKALHIINTHNSAYDDGILREQQMAYLKEFVEQEYKMGNYVLVGGDWNQCPPNLTPEFSGHKFDTVNYFVIDSDLYDKDWNWVYDTYKPTNRRVITSYTKGETPVTLIDFYLASPNIDIISCNTVALNFQNSDHNPVRMSFRMK